MPQININEIDQSIVTRVVSDDKVKVLIPGIASFGPVIDDTVNSVQTFIDVNDFEKVFGYTEPEYNPVENDVSRLYAMELIKKGAEVAFIRLNDGESSKFDIGDKTTTNEDTGETTTNREVCKAVKATKAYKDNSILTENKLPETAFMFCSQIKSIEAKYTGSFGNKLLMTITPITSGRVSYAYQYANISVYYANITYITKKNDDGTVVNISRVTSVKKLETHTVSTNPSETTYFEDVEFKYITIVPTEGARQQLTIAWSNENPAEGNVLLTSGFPEITLKVPETDDTNGSQKYNTDALLTGGMDFGYTSDIYELLQKGFNGLSAGGKFQDSDVIAYNTDVYTPNTGIIARVQNNLIECYKNFTDPYMYDFDFITTGGILDYTYTLSDDNKTVKCDQSTTNGPTYVLAANEMLKSHASMKELVETRKDCIALFDTFPMCEPESIPNYVALLDTSYGTVHNPWCYITNPNTGALVLMPPSFIFLHTLLSNLINNVEAQKWFPPAGVTRATATIVKKPLYEIGSTILDAWQNDTLSRVNPIMKLKNFGYVIYGQYTAYQAIDEYTHSALESLNVRLIANVVKKKIFTTCLKLAFEPNNPSLWLKFYNEMDQFLLYMKRNDGVYDYRVVMDNSTVTTDDINELRCPGKVYIAPTRTAEFFDIDFILTDAGASFNN